uniref:Uncharacterized protein n=1 Tax=Lymantria dispar multicapsid nuclear polyhedrosis virus TaxID=10449 RepID=A0A1B1MQU3_NPVLD|nr:hypothetical protein [Lymantria dispar multiple nucleopolyhedrovirus]
MDDRSLESLITNLSTFNQDMEHFSINSIVNEFESLELMDIEEDTDLSRFDYNNFNFDYYFVVGQKCDNDELKFITSLEIFYKVDENSSLCEVCDRLRCKCFSGTAYNCTHEEFADKGACQLCVDEEEEEDDDEEGNENCHYYTFKINDDLYKAVRFECLNNTDEMRALVENERAKTGRDVFKMLANYIVYNMKEVEKHSCEVMLHHEELKIKTYVQIHCYCLSI